MNAYKKGDYIIHARWAYPGEEIYNYLEDSRYVTDEQKCIVLHGTVDEEWTVTFDKLASTYTYDNGMAIVDSELGTIFTQGTADDPHWVAIRPIQDANAPIVFAEPTDPNDVFEVVTAWDEVLTVNRPGVPHGNGDWIVYEDAGGVPNENNRWVVNGAVFETTYVPA